MGSQEHATKAMKIADLQEALSRVVDEVHQSNIRVIVEKSGTPVAAIISATDLARFVHYEHQRAERFKVIDEMREAFKDVPPEEIERETDRAVAEIRNKTAESEDQEQQPDELWASIARMREAFKDVPDEEIERETDRIIARIRAENRAARESLAKSG